MVVELNMAFGVSGLSLADLNFAPTFSKFTVNYFQRIGIGRMFLVAGNDSDRRKHGCELGIDQAKFKAQRALDCCGKISTEVV